MTVIRMVTDEEVFEAQGPDHNIIQCNGGPHALMAVPLELIYPDERDDDPLDYLGDPPVAAKLAEDLKAGRISWEDVTPVILHHYKTKIWLGDGHHRFAAHLIAEKTHIMAFVPESLIERVTKG